MAGRRAQLTKLQFCAHQRFARARNAAAPDCLLAIRVVAAMFLDYSASHKHHVG